MGLLSGSTKTTTTSTPWQPQADALQSIFSKAGGLYDSKAGSPWYTGELYAGMDPQTKQAIQGLLQYNSGTGAQSANTLTQAGQQLTDPSRYLGAIGQYSAAASGDPTQANIRAATAYANNPAIDGMVTAASRDVTRNLYENQLPGIDRAASGSGNINSSRAGVAAGIAQRGAQDQIGDISANLRGQAYSQGLSLAENARNTNLSAMGNAAGLYGSAMGQGASDLQAGNSITQSNAQNGINASSLFQQNQQGIDNANLQRWQGNDTRDQQLLQNYYGIVGANNWGGTSTSTQSSSPSILGAALGVGSTLAGLGVKFSDRRLKTDIKKEGEMSDGLGIYSYRYKGDDSRDTGVMAQEVAKKRPWALGPKIGGFHTVNYGAL